MDISVIIPTLNEEKYIGRCIDAAQEGNPREIIVVDGGSVDGTVEVAGGKPSVRVLTSPVRGRSAQMNIGARSSDGSVILFLHADTILPDGWEEKMLSKLKESGIAGGCFSVDLPRKELIFRLTCGVWNVKSRVFKVFTGDQAIFVRRGFFEQVGGFPPVPLMEDVLLCDKLRQAGAAVVREKVSISARYWEKVGPLRAVLLMWYIKFLFRSGKSPEYLLPYYRQGKFPPLVQKPGSGNK